MISTKLTVVTKLSSRVEGKEFAVEAKPVRRGFLRKGGGRHDPEDFEVILMPASKLSSCQPPSYPYANLQVILMSTSKPSSYQPPICPPLPTSNLQVVLSHLGDHNGVGSPRTPVYIPENSQQPKVFFTQVSLLPLLSLILSFLNIIFP